MVKEKLTIQAVARFLLLLLIYYCENLQGETIGQGKYLQVQMAENQGSGPTSSIWGTEVSVLDL